MGLGGKWREEAKLFCYDPKCFTWLKCNINYGYISSWAHFICKPIFYDEFYLRFVSFGIKIRYHIMGLSHRGGDLWDTMDRHGRRLLSVAVC
jgi:hypothetical protein